MSMNLVKKLDNMDISEMDLAKFKKGNDWKTVIRKFEPIIKEMSEDMYGYCTDKIQNVYDKYLNADNKDPDFEEAGRTLKNDMERDNGPTWICIIGKDFSFNIKSQKEACLYGYYGDFGILLYKC